MTSPISDAFESVRGSGDDAPNARRQRRPPNSQSCISTVRKASSPGARASRSAIAESLSSACSAKATPTVSPLPGLRQRAVDDQALLQLHPEFRGWHRAPRNGPALIVTGVGDDQK